MATTSSKIQVQAILQAILSTNPISSAISTYVGSVCTGNEIRKIKDDIGELMERVGELEKFKAEIIADVEIILSSKSNQIVLPNLNVAYRLANIIETKDVDDNLKFMYSNLFASMLDKEKAKYVHPAFLGIIEQLTIDEIIMLRSFPNSAALAWPVVDIYDRGRGATGGSMVLSNLTDLAIERLQDKQLICCYIDNLIRLQLIFVSDCELEDDSRYKKLENWSEFTNQYVSRSYIHKNTNFYFHRKSIFLTNLGMSFKNVCFNQEINKGHRDRSC